MALYKNCITQFGAFLDPSPMGGAPHLPPQSWENGPELVKNYWLVGQKILVLLAILLLNFIILLIFDPILPKFDQTDQVN